MDSRGYRRAFEDASNGDVKGYIGGGLVPRANRSDDDVVAASRYLGDVCSVSSLSMAMMDHALPVPACHVFDVSAVMPETGRFFRVDPSSNAADIRASVSLTFWFENLRF
jgi:hypothetical protein